MAKATTAEGGDGGILARVARCEKGAMEECVDRYGSLIWSLTSRYVRQRADAEDVVQEIFTELWKSADRYDPGKSSESTFIGLIARRRSIDWLRKHSRQPQLEAIGDNMEQPEAPEAGARFDSDRVEMALRKLPEATRRLFSLHFDQGMTHPEIAAETGMPLGTVKTKLRRGLVLVRELMRESEPNCVVS